MTPSLHYEDFVQKIRVFKKDSVLLRSTEACWNINSFVNNDEKRLIRMQAPRIFCIAAATGDNTRNKEMELEDLTSLAFQYLGIEDAINDSDFIEAETENFKKTLDNTKFLRNYNISDELLRVSMQSLLISRLEQSQWNTVRQNFSITCARYWGIFRLLNNRLPTETTKFIEDFFRQEPVCAFRSIFALLALFDQDNTNKKGIVNIALNTVDKTFEKNYNIDLENIRLIAYKMSIFLENLRVWHDEVKINQKYYKKYVPIPLYKNPIITSEKMLDNKNQFICPSPEIYMLSTPDLFFREISNNHASFDKINIRSEFGYVIEEYLSKILPELFQKAEIEKISETDGKRADYLIRGKDITFLLEAKRSLGSVEARMVCDPNNVSLIWDRLCECYEQFSSTIKELSNSDRRKPIISIIIIGSGNVFSIPSILNYIFHKQNFFEELQIDYLEVMTLEEFEDLFSRVEFSKAADAIIAKWENIRSNPILDNFRQNLKLNDSEFKNEEVWLSYLKESFAELFPKLASKFNF